MNVSVTGSTRIWSIWAGTTTSRTATFGTACIGNENTKSDIDNTKAVLDGWKEFKASYLQFILGADMRDSPSENKKGLARVRTRPSFQLKVEQRCP